MHNYNTSVVSHCFHEFMNVSSRSLGRAMMNATAVIAQATGLEIALMTAMAVAAVVVVVVVVAVAVAAVAASAGQVGEAFLLPAGDEGMSVTVLVVVPCKRENINLCLFEKR